MVYRRWGKRSLDLMVGVLALLLLSPVICVLAVLVRAKLGSPILFRQERPGLHGQVFELRKFRSMTSALDAKGDLEPEEQRLTPFGKWLRATSLDELPELWNVIRGEMSLVGPRPLLVEYLPLYSPEQARRHQVRPGITGWAQVNGRNALTWEEKFQFDIWYVDHMKVSVDASILLRTIWSVFRREGINPEGSSTMPHFGQ